jgi:iron-sulfur cluster assembly protein
MSHENQVIAFRKKNPLTVTQEAEKEIIKQIQERGGKTQGIKISIITKGCTGLSYDLSFFEQTQPGDEIVEGSNYKIALDPKSLLYLLGTQLDYVKNDLGEEGFIFVNPNSKGSCGCGESFYV